VDAGEKWVRAYIEPGMYASILKDLQKQFRPEQIKYIFLDDLKTDLEKTLKEIFAFIGVNPSFNIPVKEEQNFHYDRKPFRLLSKIIGAKNARKISKKMPKNLKDIFRQKKGSVKEIPKIKREEYQLLWEVYRKDVQELEIMTNRNLSHWMPE